MNQSIKDFLLQSIKKSEDCQNQMELLEKQKKKLAEESKKLRVIINNQLLKSFAPQRSVVLEEFLIETDYKDSPAYITVVNKI